MTGFRYVFTFKELKYFLFGNKKCPLCGGNLLKQKKYELRDDLFHNSGIDPVFAPGDLAKEYSYEYHCFGCKAVFSLTDLANRRE